MKVKCEYCKKEFETTNALGAKYCSGACKQAAYRERKEQEERRQPAGKPKPAPR